MMNRNEHNKTQTPPELGASVDDDNGAGVQSKGKMCSSGLPSDGRWTLDPVSNRD